MELVPTWHLLSCRSSCANHASACMDRYHLSLHLAEGSSRRFLWLQVRLMVCGRLRTVVSLWAYRRILIHTSATVAQIHKITSSVDWHSEHVMMCHVPLMRCAHDETWNINRQCFLSSTNHRVFLAASKDILYDPLPDSTATVVDAIFCPSQYHVSLIEPEVVRSLGRVVREARNVIVR